MDDRQQGERRAWIYLGNPDSFIIDTYLSRSQNLHYWAAPQFKEDIHCGDRVFIWRAGGKKKANKANSGIIASGRIELTYVRRTDIPPQELGDDLWPDKSKITKNDMTVAFKLDSVRRQEEEGIVLRSVLREDDVLANCDIMTKPNNHSIFRLTHTQYERLEELWGGMASEETEFPETLSDESVEEGRMVLDSHLRHERAPVRQWKLKNFRILHGNSLFCEICSFHETEKYPTTLAERVFEVHHLLPFADTNDPRKTKLLDLLVVCANCHRAIHATKEWRTNVATLKDLFEKGR